MTVKQRILKLFYPLFLSLQKKQRKKILQNASGSIPSASFYSLSVPMNNGKQLSMEEFRGKKVLLVNTASDCGYTAQLGELQKLYQHLREDLVVIGFPANDFKNQESGSDDSIAQFCSLNYGVSFPLAKKSQVSPGAGQNPVFGWLTTKKLNGWNEQAPSWNFSKYLVNGEGLLTHYFDPAISPLSEEVLKAVNE